MRAYRFVGDLRRLEFLKIMPRLAACIVVGVAGIGLFVRAAWPSGGEALLLFSSVACIYGALRLRSPITRVLCAMVWVGLLIVHGMQAPWRHTGLDFQNFYDGAYFLFEQGISPYPRSVSNAFPFPTYLLVYGLSLGSRLSADITRQIFVALEVLLLGAAVVLMRRVIIKEMSSVTPDFAVSMLMVGLVIHPAIVDGLALGRSSMLAGIAVACALWCWRCGSGKGSLHAAAILLNLAWMIKPHLLMASGFFLFHWMLSGKQVDPFRNRAACIGKLFSPWAAAILGFSALIAYPTHLYAYLDFPKAAREYMTSVSEGYANNFAIPAILSKAAIRLWGVPYLQTVSVLGAGIASGVILWNLAVLFVLRRNSVGAFIPWLMSSLFWATTMWNFYLSLIFAGTMFLCFSSSRPGLADTNITTFWLAAAIGCTMVFSSFIFTVGAVLLYFLSIEMLTKDCVENSCERLPETRGGVV